MSLHLALKSQQRRNRKEKTQKHKNRGNASRRGVIRLISWKCLLNYKSKLKETRAHTETIDSGRQVLLNIRFGDVIYSRKIKTFLIKPRESDFEKDVSERLVVTVRCVNSL